MQKRSVKRWMMAGIVVAAAMVWAGSLDSPAPPSDAASAMYTLEDIYNRLDTGAAGAKRTGGFVEPGAAPASTGHTLDEAMAKTPAMDNTNGATPEDVSLGKTFWGLKDGTWGSQTGTATAGAPAPVPKTGQTTSCRTGDDGDLQPGVASPSPRFTDNGNDTVTDNLTGLMWAKNANLPNGAKTWNDAIAFCNALSLRGHDDWRLPTVRELQSLIDFGNYYPALPSGHPFADVQPNYYWSSTPLAGSTSPSHAWIVFLPYGAVNDFAKTYSYYVWPVRGGQ